MPQLSLHTPLGPLTLAEEDGAVVSLDWGWGRDQAHTALLLRAKEQLHLYFDGELTQFDLPLAAVGSAYRQRVWHTMLTIPFGGTCSYQAMAARCGGSARSVGGASGANPIPIIIPCHRVVGSASLGGYSGGNGVETKRWLLTLEQSGGLVPELRMLRRGPGVTADDGRSRR